MTTDIVWQGAVFLQAPPTSMPPLSQENTTVDEKQQKDGTKFLQE